MTSVNMYLYDIVVFFLVVNRVGRLPCLFVLQILIGSR